MAKALEREMSDFFGRQYDEAWKVDGNEIAKLYCAPTVTVRADGSIHCLQSQNELARFFQGVLDTYRSQGASLVGLCTTLWSFQSATEVPWRP